MTSKINNRLLQVCLDFCGCSTAFNSSNNFIYAKTDVENVMIINQSSDNKTFTLTDEKPDIEPVTLIRL